MSAIPHLSRRPYRWLAGVAVAVLVGGLLPDSAPAAPADHTRKGQWTMGGFDYANSRSNPVERTIGTRNADELALKWTATTSGDVSATPAVVDGAVYFPDWGGTFWKVDARTGEAIWSRSVADYTGVARAVSRTSPTVVGDTVYIGTQRGARLLAIDTETGDLRWQQTMDEHQYAILTQSPVVYQGVVYQGVSSDEEIAVVNPDLPCCTFRGSLVATDAETGEVLWKTYTISEQGEGTDVFSGAAVWSGVPAIDPQTDTIYITTGNNYEIPQSAMECQQAGGTPAECLPEWNMIDSFIALDADTGEIRWRTGQNRFDSWNLGCIPGAPAPNNCPVLVGPDHDFADGAHLFTIPGPDDEPRKAVGAGQKSGEYWMLDATTGEVLWSAATGPGSALGGIEWGTATDGERIYFAQNNADRQEYELPDGQVIDYASYGALDPATGEVLWQIAEPNQGEAPAAVSTANGVAYFCSLTGHMYAIDAATGTVLWQYLGEGSCNAGPAIVDGTVYWGNGYAKISGTRSTTFYAFSVPRD